MSTYLYRLGRFAFGRPWLVIGGWLALIAVVAGLLVTNPPKISNEMRINGTPAQEVIDDLAQRMPESSGGQGLIAFAVPAGQRIDDGANSAAVVRAVEAVSRSEHVLDPRALAQAELAKGPASPTLTASAAIARSAVPTDAGPNVPHPMVINGQPVPGVLVSADGVAALYQFQFDKQTAELPSGTVEHTVTAARDAVAGTGINVLPSASMVEMPDIVGAGEVIGLAVAALVLIVTLGSLVAAGLPLATALSSVAVGVGGTFLFSHLVNIQSMTAVLALMLGLAVGIDYAMFIVNRQRRLIIDQGLSAGEAAGRALGTAGSAVIFAGTTVVIALVALTVVGISLLTPMALAAAATVVVAVIAALTLLPALLGLVGERICSDKTRRTQSTEKGTNHRFATAWVGAVLRHRVPVAIGGVVVAALLALPALNMTMGLPSGSSYNQGTPQRESYDLVSTHYGEGYNGPLVVVAEPAAGTGKLTTADLVDTNNDLRRLGSVESVSLQKVSDNEEFALFSVVPSTGPTDDATAQLVRDIRAHAGPLTELHDVDLGVTGITAMGVDTTDRLAQAVPLYIGVVVGLSLLVLLVVFRSIAIPVKATVGFLLSVLATFGAATALFQWGWFQQLFGLSATGPILSLLPIIVIGVLYGLAMDYQVFLVSSMKEAHVHGHRGDDAVTHGFTQASRVVVAAAVIMMSVFAGFVFNGDPMIKQIGFALAFGVLIDAFVVRMAIVPAVMSMLGEKAWWLPKRLERFLPNLDIEGDQLNKQLADTPA
ncbi:transporter [Mycolicibacterium conceptionense]|uniref:Transporter n=2 Tax=Mycolicibacterium TaxID=1866885 RepID=A0A1A0PPE5_9MYCO|nr:MULTISPECIES: MMPL family transporter [Mycolicibacterium]MCW1819723.1 MMPL family transporter [Mycolicibacterium senegalense]OBB11597.1 transporter [Mycolicibacterium conceptionense]OBF08708.1 transporter [Mycolicibacterium conceptionense]OBF12838.1 transporter [Mycolicibacterium conceptionense]OBF45353.1 transporter [Mycolicibacterium conceptionense]